MLYNIKQFKKGVNMNREKLIEFLEQNNLLEVLQRQIYYINYPRYRKVIGQSRYFNYLKRIEMHYNTIYYIQGYDFFKEEDNNIIFDEYHYLQSKEKSPIECYTEKKINMIELKRLIRMLPENKLMILLRKLNFPKSDLEKIIDSFIEINEDKIVNVEKNKSDMQILTKSINDIQTGLLNIMSVMGDKITSLDMQNVDRIIKKATTYLSNLNQETIEKEDEKPCSLKLK